MKPRNRYFLGTHILEPDFRRLLKEFCRDTLATETAERTGISRPTVNDMYRLLRERIFLLAQAEAREVFDDESEIDESYFGAHRVRGKRGRGAGGKIPVFGILKRGGRVYTRISRELFQGSAAAYLAGQGDCRHESVFRRLGRVRWPGIQLRPLPRAPLSQRVRPRQESYQRHRVVRSWAKRRLRRFNGIRRQDFPLHLKECEWRFNHREDDLYTILLAELRKNPLKRGC